MTLRFSLNNYYSGISSISYYLYDIYRFMTLSSPNGPGWTTIGESNGTVGGMGTTGIITSFSSLLSINAWFVLRSPDSKIQILFRRGNATVNYAGFYLTHGEFTGGSASTIPTFDSTKTIPFATALRLSTTSNYIVHIVADDFFPYNFYAASVNINPVPTTTTFVSYINIDGYSSDDGYPYVFLTTSSSGPLYSVLDQSTDTTYGTKSFNYTGTGYGVCPPCQFSINTTRMFPNVGPSGVSNGCDLLTVPILFSSRVLYKGIHYSWFRWPSNAVLADNDTIDNKKWIRFGDLICPWDGATTPKVV